MTNVIQLPPPYLRLPDRIKRTPARGQHAEVLNDLLAKADPPVDSPTPVERQAVAAYDGQRLLGHFATVDGFWRAWRADGIPLGVYPTRGEARAASHRVSALALSLAWSADYGQA